MGTMTQQEQIIQQIKAARSINELKALAEKFKAFDEDEGVRQAFDDAFADPAFSNDPPPAMTEETRTERRPQQRAQQGQRTQQPAAAPASRPLPIARPQGIAGVSGREPVGAVLTIGHKGPKGNPTDTDRFFIVLPQMADNVRPVHPSFKAFNDAPAERRQTIRGHLIHATRAAMFEHSLKAQVLPKPHPAHPNKVPACVGDGERAVRWNGTEFKEIRCPNELCEFRQKTSGATICKPFMRVLFRPRWADVSTKGADGTVVSTAENPFPTPLMKFTSGSWNNVRAFIGFFDYIEEQARLLGVEDVSLYGLPFTLTLSKKSIAAQQRAFPVVSITPDGDVQAFLAAQIRNRRDLALTAPPMRQIAALTDAAERAPDVEDADYVTINPGLGIPAQVAAP